MASLIFNTDPGGLSIQRRRTSASEICTVALRVEIVRTGWQREPVRFRRDFAWSSQVATAPSRSRPVLTALTLCFPLFSPFLGPNRLMAHRSRRCRNRSRSHAEERAQRRGAADEQLIGPQGDAERERDHGKIAQERVRLAGEQGEREEKEVEHRQVQHVERVGGLREIAPEPVSGGEVAHIPYGRLSIEPGGITIGSQMGEIRLQVGCTNSM
jgi:hypothetical protein